MMQSLKAVPVDTKCIYMRILLILLFFNSSFLMAQKRILIDASGLQLIDKLKGKSFYKVEKSLHTWGKSAKVILLDKDKMTEVMITEINIDFPEFISSESNYQKAQLEVEAKNAANIKKAHHFIKDFQPTIVLILTGMTTSSEVNKYNIDVHQGGYLTSIVEGLYFFDEDNAKIEKFPAKNVLKKCALKNTYEGVFVKTATIRFGMRYTNSSDSLPKLASSAQTLLDDKALIVEAIEEGYNNNTDIGLSLLDIDFGYEPTCVLVGGIIYSKDAHLIGFEQRDPERYEKTIKNIIENLPSWVATLSQ